jgi:hypothetical protein
MKKIKAQKALNLFGSQNVRKVQVVRLYMYSATNAFKHFNCSKLAIRLIATLIFNPMFI